MFLSQRLDLLARHSRIRSHCYELAFDEYVAGVVTVQSA